MTILDALDDDRPRSLLAIYTALRDDKSGRIEVDLIDHLLRRVLTTEQLRGLAVQVRDGLPEAVE
jgi:hypothetical protein